MVSAEENGELLRRGREALVPNVRIVIQDFILEPDKTSPKSAALFALNMLVGKTAESSYSMDEYDAWLQQGGFEDVQHVRLPGPSGLMVGVRR